VCDLNPRDINGLPGALSFILCGQTVFSLAVNPGQTGEGREGAILRSEPRKLSCARLLIRPMVATLPVVIAFCLKWVLWSAMSPWAWLLLYAGVFLFLARGTACWLVRDGYVHAVVLHFFLPPERPLRAADSVYVFWRAVSAFRASSSASSTST
jgi:hypothetical protein